MTIKTNTSSIATTWARRAQAEIGAEARFKILKEELIDLKASDLVIGLADKAIKEEADHAIMCADMAKDLGHGTGYELFEGRPQNFTRPWADLKDPRDKLLCEMTLMCCLTETINASLLSSIYTNAPASKARKVIHQILKDETKHAQMGWAHLQAEGKKRDVTFLHKFLPAMFEISVKDELFVPHVGGASHEGEDSFKQGVLPVSFRLGQFLKTAENVVFPGLQHFGIETQSSKKWLESKMSHVS